MSKVICDVCGTTYPETATQCPICGCAKNSVTQTAATGSDWEAGESTYSYVKGGRFSEKNVKKRNAGARTPERRSAPSAGQNPQRRSAPAQTEGNPRRRPREEEKSNLGLIIIVIILLIAIIAVVIILADRYLDGNEQSSGQTGNGFSQATEPSDSQPENPDVPDGSDQIPCQSFQLSHSNIEFIKAGDTWTLETRLTPENTTDKPTYTSSDPAVATVSEAGVVTAVAHGEAMITVKCGAATQTCLIKCSFGSESVDPPASGNEFDFAFNSRYYQEATGKWEVTLMKAGETWRSYKNDLSIAPELITWVSDDPSVCTIEKGVVTAVGPGKTEVHAQYNGITYSCQVTCKFSAATGGDTNSGGDQPATGTCTISATDVTLTIGADESFTLKLKDSNGNVLDVTWTADKQGYVVISGNKITGVAEIGMLTVSTTYEGVTYSCIVRVKNG